MVETFADMYDRATGNRAKVGMVASASMHLGMIGHGSYLPGSDSDVAVLGHGLGIHTNREYFTLPSHLRDEWGARAARAIDKLDRADGALDGQWMGHEISDEDRLKVPLQTFTHTSVITELLAREGFGRDRITDLFFINYKDPDYLGHAYNFTAPEVGETISYADGALRDLLAFLRQSIGRKGWVVVVTADHGQSPPPQEAGMWPMSLLELQKDVGTFVGLDQEDLIQYTKQNGLWLDRASLKAGGVTMKQLSRFLVNYKIRDNASGRVPETYADRLDEFVFDAAFPSSEMTRVLRCATRSRGE